MGDYKTLKYREMKKIVDDLTSLNRKELMKIIAELRGVWFRASYYRLCSDEGLRHTIRNLRKKD